MHLGVQTMYIFIIQLWINDVTITHMMVYRPDTRFQGAYKHHSNYQVL